MFEVKHIRAIARCPVHLTRESTAALYARLGMRTPVQQLLSTLKGRLPAKLAPESGHSLWIRERYKHLQELIQLQAAGMRPQVLKKLLVRRVANTLELLKP